MKNTSPPQHHQPRLKLFWRVFLIGFTMVASAVVISAVVTDILAHIRPDRAMLLHIASDIKERFGDRPIPSAACEARLETWHHLLGRDIALLKEDGGVILAVEHGPPFEPRLTELTPLNAQIDNAQTAYLWVDSQWGDLRTERIVALAITLFLLALASGILVRRLSKPLDQLITTARRLASGDLEARADLESKNELGLLGRTIDSMAEKLNIKVRQERELLANISHEIRTPLTRLRLGLELCDEPHSTLQDVRNYLDGMGEDLEDLEKLIQDVFEITKLDLVKTDMGDTGFRLEPEIFDFSVLLDDSIRMVERRHPEQRFTHLYSSELPMVKADRRLFKRVLTNLMDNAAKYSEPTHPIEVYAKCTRNTLQIEISDRGIGIPKEDLIHIFEPFYRSERGRSKRPTGGTGLGLTLTKRIIEAHGGWIEARQRPGGGTIIVLECNFVENSEF